MHLHAYHRNIFSQLAHTMTSYFHPTVWSYSLDNSSLDMAQRARSVYNLLDNYIILDEEDGEFNNSKNMVFMNQEDYLILSDFLDEMYKSSNWEDNAKYLSFTRYLDEKYVEITEIIESYVSQFNIQ